MTRVRRVWNILSGILIIAVGLMLLIDPLGGLQVVTLILSVTVTLRGLQAMAYYFSMARFMVGGKRILYRGMFYLDLGILTAAVRDSHYGYIILYIAALHIFAGAVDILNGIEARKLGSPSWKSGILYGAVNVATAIAVLIGGLAFNSVRMVVYIYAVGIIYAAIVRIGSAFRKTEIVYIQ